MEYKIMTPITDRTFDKLHTYNASHTKKLHLLLGQYCFYCEKCGAHVVWPVICEDEYEFRGIIDDFKLIHVGTYRKQLMHMQKCPVCNNSIPREYYFYSENYNVENEDDRSLDKDKGVFAEISSYWVDVENRPSYEDTTYRNEHDKDSAETIYDVTDSYNEEVYHHKLKKCFEIMRKERLAFKQSVAIQKTDEEVKIFFRDTLLEAAIEPQDIGTDEIIGLKGSNEKLTQYVKKAMEIELSKQSMESWIHFLWNNDNSARVEKNMAVQDYAFLTEEAYKENLNEIEKEYEKKLEVIQQDNYGIKFLTPTVVKPVALPYPPNEPIFETPGFFNKKKVQQENDRRRVEYENRLKEYQTLKDKYEIDMREYTRSCDLVESENDKLRERIRNNRKESTNRAISEKERRIRELKQQYDDSDVSKLREVVIYQLINDELEFAKKEYKKLLNTRNEFYSADIVFDKYRNLTAMATMYEYLASGRCTSLSGSDGAYNLYETEIRANAIITKLDIVIDKLEDIRQTQHTLCSILSSMQYDLNRIDNKFNKACDALSAINESTRINALNSEAIAKNTSISAYYDEKTAYYAKISAETSIAGLFR